MAFFAVGPGVCVWLALSELMPTRIRSNGMSIALLLNQFVSTTIAAVFLPTVGNYGYAAMFFFWSGCTVIYFLTVGLPPAGDQGQDPGGDRGTLQRPRNIVAGDAGSSHQGLANQQLPGSTVILSAVKDLVLMHGISLRLAQDDCHWFAEANLRKPPDLWMASYMATMFSVGLTGWRLWQGAQIQRASR